VALAQRLEQERRETLSLAQVNQLAEELNLDPLVLRQALARVSADEARQAVTQAQTRSAAPQHHGRRALVALALAFLLEIGLLLFGYASSQVAPPPPTMVPVQPVMAPSEPPPMQPPGSPLPPPTPTEATPQAEGR
jgi:hypothetical protein